jgi:hypothetical protein
MQFVWLVKSKPWINDHSRHYTSFHSRVQPKVIIRPIGPVRPISSLE